MYATNALRQRRHFVRQARRGRVKTRRVARRISTISVSCDCASIDVEEPVERVQHNAPAPAAMRQRCSTRPPRQVEDERPVGAVPGRTLGFTTGANRDRRSGPPARTCGQSAGSYDSIGISSSAYGRNAELRVAAHHDRTDADNVRAGRAHDIDHLSHRKPGRDDVFNDQRAIARAERETAAQHGTPSSFSTKIAADVPRLRAVSYPSTMPPTAALTTTVGAHRQTRRAISPSPPVRRVRDLRESGTSE